MPDLFKKYVSEAELNTKIESIDAEAVGADAAGSAEQALSDAKTYANKQAEDAVKSANEYTDQKISAIPTPDVSGQIGAHNSDTTAHSDIRTALGTKAASSDLTSHTNSKNNPHEVTAEQVGARPNTWVPSAAEVGADASGSASKALEDANKYTDQKIAAIPTPDVSGQIGTHNTDTSAHNDIRITLGNKANASDLTSHTDSKNNPHEVTAEQVGARPNTWTPSASDVGADPAGTAAQALVDANEYTDQKIAAIPTPDVSGQIGTHNTNTEAHADIRTLISGLTERLNALADSDDTTLDQMSEVVAYIKSNKSLIEGITTSKISVSDIVNDLTTNTTNQVLSAAQGVALKGLIDALQTAVDGKAPASHGTHVEYSTVDPTMDGAASVGTAGTVARSDHKHPTDTSRASASDLSSHTSNKSNPHAVTAAQVGARPDTWMPTASDVGADASGSAATALSDANKYTDQKIAAIPTPDVSGQIGTHNADTTAHSDIRTALGTKAATSDLTSHTSNKSNPHGVTAAQVGARPDSWLPTPGDIGAAEASHGTHVTYTTTSPKANGTAAVGTESTVSRGDHVHPTDTTRAAASDLSSHTGNKSNPHGVTLAQLSVTATAAELNILDGVTATAAELNVLDGITATTTELNYVDGVTSNIQTQLNGKLGSTANAASATKATQDGSGNVITSTYATKTELNGKAGTSVATSSANGLMSSTDKAKLDKMSTISYTVVSTVSDISI